MRWLLVLILMMAVPAWAFVSRIDPTTETRVPCHQFRGAVVEFAHGEFTAPQLAAWLENTFLVPYGDAWSSEDDTDNGNLIVLLNSLGTTTEKVLVGMRIEGLCAAWEADHGLFTRNQFRTRIGIATQ